MTLTGLGGDLPSSSSPPSSPLSLLLTRESVVLINNTSYTGKHRYVYEDVNAGWWQSVSDFPVNKYPVACSVLWHNKRKMICLGYPDSLFLCVKSARWEPGYCFVYCLDRGAFSERIDSGKISGYVWFDKLDWLCGFTLYNGRKAMLCWLLILNKSEYLRSVLY